MSVHGEGLGILEETAIGKEPTCVNAFAHLRVQSANLGRQMRGKEASGVRGSSEYSGTCSPQVVQWKTQFICSTATSVLGGETTPVTTQ